MGWNVPFYKDIRSALLLFSVVLLLLFIRLQDTGRWPLPDDWIGPIWLGLSTIVSLAVSFRRQPPQEKSKFISESDSPTRNQPDRETDISNMRGVRDFQYGIFSLFLGLGIVNIVTLLRHLQYIEVSGVWMAPIGFAGIGISYLAIRYLRRIGKLN